jgi:hypothetical protein
MKGPDIDYDKQIIPVVICDTDIWWRLTIYQMGHVQGITLYNTFI